MDKININNLFPYANDFKPLDVYSLYHTRDKQITNKINFNIERLIKLREERKNKILIQYEKIFNMCLKKINTANNLNKTEIVYDVPEAIFGYLEYNRLRCLEYIEKKLKDMHLDALILNNKTIYVSWLNLGDNMRHYADNNKN
jgi:hypothetical protein